MLAIRIFPFKHFLTIYFDFPGNGQNVFPTKTCMKVKNLTTQILQRSEHLFLTSEKNGNHIQENGRYFIAQNFPEKQKMLILNARNNTFSAYCSFKTIN